MNHRSLTCHFSNVILDLKAVIWSLWSAGCGAGRVVTFIMGRWTTLLFVQNNSNVKVKMSSHIALYPVLGPPWSGFMVYSLVDLFNWTWQACLWCTQSTVAPIDTGASDNLSQPQLLFLTAADSKQDGPHTEAPYWAQLNSIVEH